jgi:CNT family concentrative nucleoside transporter
MSGKIISFFGIFCLVGIAWLMSTDRRAIKWRPVIWGVALQMGFGMIILLPKTGEKLFEWVDIGVNKLLSFSQAGSRFLFQSLVPHDIVVYDDLGDAVAQTFIGGGALSPPVQTFAFWILPTVIFFSGLMAVLYHYGVMQVLVNAFAKLMQKTMGTSGAESLSAAANIFVGQTEAPLVVRPFVNKMTMSELNAVMVGGFATVAGAVMAIYVGILPMIEGIAGHLVMASIMSAPAALAIAKVMIPEKEVSASIGDTRITIERPDVNGLEALTRGTLEGLKLCLNIAAMLLVFVAMVAMCNALLGTVGNLFNIEDLTLEGILGWLFSPLAFLMGIPWAEAQVVGTLLGEKMVLTELIAFLDFSAIQNGPNPLSDRSAVITSYALCGFANFASIGIQIGGIGGLAPERRGDLARVGMRAMIGGTLAAMMTGAVAGVLY